MGKKETPQTQVTKEQTTATVMDAWNRAMLEDAILSGPLSKGHPIMANPNPTQPNPAPSTPHPAQPSTPQPSAPPHPTPGGTPSR